MLREAVAWWVEQNKLLEKLNECEKKFQEAKEGRDKGDRKVKPDKALSNCLEQKLPSCLKGEGTEKSFCLIGCALHLDAYGWKKDLVVKQYLKERCPSNTRGRDKEISAKIKEMSDAGFVPAFSPEQLRSLLPGSFGVSFSFRLRQPYISKDDTEFYVIDNPVKKDWVFKVPYIAPSQWKGCLHAAMVRQLADWWAGLPDEERGRDENKKEFVERRLQLVRLFGNEQGVEVDTSKFDSYLDEVGGSDLARGYRDRLKKIAPGGHRRGRLVFYPTFFDRLGVEVINPHDRKTGAGKFPIYFETVPLETSGCFALLYVPFDRAGKDAGETLREAAADLYRVAAGIAFLLTEFGFGAKTASGFGVVASELPSEGTIAFRAAGEDPLRAKFKSLDPENEGGLLEAAAKVARRFGQGVTGSDS